MTLYAPDLSNRPEPELDADGWPAGYPRPGPGDQPGMDLRYRPVLWRGAELEAATGGRWISGGARFHGTGLSRHVALVRPGDIFIAHASTADRDDHHLVPAAFRKGAVAAIVSRRPTGVADGQPLLEVADTHAAIRALARAARQRTRARLVAVTGSVGKTGTKDALLHVLSRQAPTVATWHNDNSEIGVSLALAQIPAACDYAILEAGMHRHAERFAATCAAIAPTVALITAIAPEHLCEHPDLEDIARTKAHLIRAVAVGGAAVLPRDSELFETLRKAAEEVAHRPHVLTFGRHRQADVRLVSVRLDGLGSEVSCMAAGQRLDYRLGVPGGHWVDNSLAVIAVLLALDADLGLATQSLAGVRPGFRRGERLRAEPAAGPIEIVDDSFSASPASMRAALEQMALVAAPAGGRKLLVLGSMWGLGPRSAELHRALAPAVLAAGPDLVCTVGTQMRPLHDALPAAVRGPHVDQATAMAARIGALVQGRDLVLVKGSLRLDMWRIVAALLPWERRAEHLMPPGWSLAGELGSAP